MCTEIKKVFNNITFKLLILNLDLILKGFEKLQYENEIA